LLSSYLVGVISVGKLSERMGRFFSGREGYDSPKISTHFSLPFFLLSLTILIDGFDLIISGHFQGFSAESGKFLVRAIFSKQNV